MSQFSKQYCQYKWLNGWTNKGINELKWTKDTYRNDHNNKRTNNEGTKKLINEGINKLMKKTNEKLSTVVSKWERFNQTSDFNSRSQPDLHQI